MTSEKNELDLLREALADRYAIEREIGAGGMATVYLAQDLRHNRKVAVKVLRSDLAASLGSERFLREVQVTANLQHPHILPLYDSGEADGFLFYVMPFIEGESLRDRLVRERELPVTDAARLLRDVVDALTAAHRLGVVHRDIKPENVLLSGRHAMVADFGVAKAVSEATGRHQLTTLGVALGTPSYMAPEQAAADEKIDHRADIYAVGAMAYELLTGRPPFTGGTPQQILASQVVDQPKPVSELRPAVPPALEMLVMRCLEKKPADRWQTAEEMLPHLETAATPSGGMTPTGLTPVKKAALLWKRPVFSLGVGVAVVAVAAVAYQALRSGASGPELDQGAPTAASSSDTLDSLHVVVLPFENRSGTEDGNLLGNMVAEWTARNLNQVRSFNLVPSTAVQDILRGLADPSAVPALDLARRTGAGFAVSGNVARLGANLRFEAEILNVETGELLRSLDPVSGPTDSVEAVVTRASRAFAAGTAAVLAPGPWTLEGCNLPPTMEAYLAYNTGASAFCEGRYDAAAEGFFRASDLAPSWPTPLLNLLPTLANAGRGEERDSILRVMEPLLPSLTPMERLQWDWMERESTLYERYRAAEDLFEIHQAQFGYSLAFSAQWINRLDRARAGVLAIDFDYPCTQTWPANYLLTAQTLHLVGEDEGALARAIDGRQRFPQSGSILLAEARALAGLGEVDHVLALADTLKNLPSSTTRIASRLVEMTLELRVHGAREASVRLLEDALDWADQHTNVDPFQRTRVLYYLERYDEALPLLQELASDNPISQNLGYLALTLDGLDRGAEADSVLVEFADRFPRVPYPALLAAGRGDARRAVELLRGNFDAGMVYYANGQVNLHWDPDLEPIRDDPLFQALMRSTG